MAIIKATGVLEDGFRVRVQTGGHEYVLDEVAQRGGTNQGAMPGEVLLAGLLGCQAMVTRLFFRKRRQQPRSVRVDAEMNQAGEGRLNVAFDVVLTVDADLTDDELTELAAFIDAECAVGNLLRQQNPVNFTVRRS